MLHSPISQSSTVTGILTPNASGNESRPSLAGRRSTLKRSIDDTRIMDIPPSPSKRSRVTFDSKVEIVPADEENTNPQIVKEQVRRAIERHKIGDDEAYEQIKSFFTVATDDENAPSPEVLKIHLQAMLSEVSSLTKDCSGLVSAIVFSEWVGREEAYFSLFIKFLNNLAAAQRGYQQKIMQMLVERLGPQKTRRLPGSKPIRQPKIHRRVLQTIQYLTSNVPSMLNLLADRVAARLQFDFAKAEHRMIYIRSFIQLIKYVPELKSELLTSIFRDLIKLDVLVQAELDEKGEDAEAEIVKDLSMAQVLPKSSPQESKNNTDEENDYESSTTELSDSEDEELDSAAARRKKLKETVRQVDEIMEILFQYYDQLITSSSLQTRRDPVDQLITQFHDLILPTYRVRHPQFLIFHFAQGDPIIVDQFVTSCVKILIDRKQPQVLRHSAAAHLSGFVGRGAHVPPYLVQDCLELLCGRLNNLRIAYELTCRGPDLKRFGDFYSVFQAVIYIFCFRWKDIAFASRAMDDEESETEDNNVEHYNFPEPLKEALRAAIYSNLNPLRVCTPDIVEQFAELSCALRFIYVYPKLEENKHVRIVTHWRTLSDLTISQPDRDLSWVGDNGMLEGYFPYDPYHLPISKRWVEGDYVKWNGIPGEEQDDTDSEDDGGMNVLLEDEYIRPVSPDHKEDTKRILFG